MSKTPHESCPEVVRDTMHALGAEVTVSEAEPLVIGPYTTAPITCPHGTVYWMEPTGEQIAQWVKDQVP